MSGVGEAYSAGALSWAGGPDRIYAKLADLLVQFSPVPLSGRLVLDLGSGTGTGSRAAAGAGARVVAVDLAPGMLQVDRANRPPAVVGRAERLPFRAGALDAVLAPFSLNHLRDAADGVREAGRVASTLVASTYADDDDHPVKAAVDSALAEVGWTPPDWYAALKVGMAAWGTVAHATEAIVRGGMRPLRVERLEVPFPELGPDDMVAWRMGLAQSASFFDQLDERRRADTWARARDLLGPSPAPVVRRVIFLAAVASPRGGASEDVATAQRPEHEPARDDG